LLFFGSFKFAISNSGFDENLSSNPLLSTPAAAFVAILLSVMRCFGLVFQLKM
jgi:hypothetical protein